MQKQLNGVIVVDKPADISSARAVAFVKRITHAKKVGHAGTLDPFAEGVLICCLNKATRLTRFWLQGNKTYEAVLKLGEETDTQDSTGSVIAVGNPAGPFKCCKIAHQDAHFSGNGDAGHPGQGDGNSQGTGAGNNHHGYGSQDRCFQR